MRILLLDRNYGTQTKHPRLIHYFREPLQQRGHEVTAVRHLERLPPKQGLERYNLVIAHPTGNDARRLFDEVQRRKNLHVVLHTLDPSGYTHEPFRETEQVCSYFSIDPQRFIYFLEEHYLRTRRRRR